MIGSMDLGNVCDVVDALINNAQDFRTRNRLEYDSIIIVEMSQSMLDKIAAWGAIDYLEIAYRIHVKVKEN